MLRAVLVQVLALLAVIAVAAAWDDWHRPDPGPLDAEIDALFQEFGM